MVVGWSNRVIVSEGRGHFVNDYWEGKYTYTIKGHFDCL